VVRNRTGYRYGFEFVDLTGHDLEQRWSAFSVITSEKSA
jgi:hypothetical protein